MDNTEVKFPDQSAFEYDYETLQTTGLILGIIMFVAGIVIAMSKKCCKCDGASSKSGSCGTEIPHKEMAPV